MPTQAVALHRCASCDRWSGRRTIGTPPQTVDIDNELSVGLCVDGPWSGNERRARSACGHWTVWLAIAQPKPGA
jgi:hypothetical protein